MNRFFFILILCNSLFASENASTIGLGTGGLTPHFTETKKNYCNQWNDTGIIANRSYYARLQLNGVGFTYVIGHDSICSRIEGMMFHSVFKSYEYIDFSMVIGGYTYEQRNWDKYAKETPEGIDAPAPVSVNLFGKMTVPVLALGVDIHMIRRDSWSLKLVNLLTPIITNHSIMYEYRF